ncbi:MAG TPA: glutathione peroxidase [Pyrinomonadaceae bacterium]|nr:glutathione peroxidase [Chloracidobacterium sp.]HQX56353.1 glutathione peroxidase [Pyrinomonadaceae bacterium]MBK7803742.1 glutathione peroxidase [Chloracidobacterium sp.]MBK9439585.1 glutathione peroxidase [Chloracidobacterium sp.]MBK9768503.1 glutathione peroxidase [Chloracidobacterium sp.]
MLKIVGVLLILIVGAGVGAAYKYGFILNPSPTAPPPESSVYDFTMRDIDGENVNLGIYKGKVVMIVNVASKCGYTPQYEGLQALYEKNKGSGLVILGFPANNFLSQEPGTEAEIKEFCSTKYKVTFPMFAKISVKGEDQHPLYTYLTNKISDPEFAGDISWNFNKFLIDRHGKVVARFGSKDTPDGEAITSAVAKYLADK